MRVKRGHARRWDAAERTVMEGGSQKLIDAYRSLHGYSRQEFSWFLGHGQTRIGRRFDHAFCSQELVIAAANICTKCAKLDSAIMPRWSLIFRDCDTRTRSVRCARRWSRGGVDQLLDHY